MEHLKALSIKDPVRSLLGIGRTWALIFIGFYIYTRFPSALTASLLFIINGVLIYHLNILGHDGIHYLLHDSKQVNDVLCRFFLLGPQFTPLTAIRSNHLNHHRTLGSERDADRQYYERMLMKGKAGLVSSLILSFTGAMLFPIAAKLLFSKGTKKRESKKSFELMDFASVAVSQAVILGFVWTITGHWWAWIVFWVLPTFTIMIGLNSVRSCLEHADPKTPPQRDRSFISSRIERFFLAPFNMNYHAEHHRYPTVPFFRLPDLRAALLLENHELVLERSYGERFLSIMRMSDFE